MQGMLNLFYYESMGKEKAFVVHRAHVVAIWRKYNLRQNNDVSARINANNWC